MSERPLQIAIVIGEESGDQLGAGLMDAIRRRRPRAGFVGIAGERMAARGLESFFPMGDIAVMGLASIVGHLPRIVRRGYQAVSAVLEARPDVLVVIDSPGFTHAVAKRVARRRPDLPIVNYVSPQVWAWRVGRVPRMGRYIDHVLALLPFEPELYGRLGGPACTYVGHPLIEKLDVLRPAAGERGSIGPGPVLLVLPGSRRTEIARLMEPFGQAVRLIAEARPGVEVLLPSVRHLQSEIERHAANWPIPPRIVIGEAEKFAAFRRAHAALAASGTVTLELGLSGVPMVVAYRVEPLLRFLKRFLRLHSIVLANLALGENAVPEFLDEAGSPEALAKATLSLLSETPARAAQLSALARLDEVMRVPVAPSDRAAEIVIEAAESGVRRSGRRQSS